MCSQLSKNELLIVMEFYSDQPRRPPVAALIKEAEKLAYLSIAHLQEIALRSIEDIAHTFPKSELQALSAEPQPPSEYRANAEQHSHLLAFIHTQACDKGSPLKKDLVHIFKLIIGRAKMVLDRDFTEPSTQPLPQTWTPEHAKQRTLTFNKYLCSYLNKLYSHDWMQCYKEALAQVYTRTLALNPSLAHSTAQAQVKHQARAQTQSKVLFESLTQPQVSALAQAKAEARANPREFVPTQPKPTTSGLPTDLKDTLARNQDLTTHQKQVITQLVALQNAAQTKEKSRLNSMARTPSTLNKPEAQSDSKGSVPTQPEPKVQAQPSKLAEKTVDATAEAQSKPCIDDIYQQYNTCCVDPAEGPASRDYEKFGRIDQDKLYRYQMQRMADIQAHLRRQEEQRDRVPTAEPTPEAPAQSQKEEEPKVDFDTVTRHLELKLESRDAEFEKLNRQMNRELKKSMEQEKGSQYAQFVQKEQMEDLRQAMLEIQTKKSTTMTMLQGEIAALTNANNYLSTENSMVKEMNESFKKKSAADVIALDKCEKECEDLESEVRDMKSKSEFVDDAINEMMRTVDELESELKEVKAELEKKKEKKESEANGFEYCDL